MHGGYLAALDNHWDTDAAIIIVLGSDSIIAGRQRDNGRDFVVGPSAVINPLKEFSVLAVYAVARMRIILKVLPSMLHFGRRIDRQITDACAIEFAKRRSQWRRANGLSNKRIARLAGSPDEGRTDRTAGKPTTNSAPDFILDWQCLDSQSGIHANSI
jgi:hypothetical protein